MRLSYIAVASIALVAGAGGIRANVVGAAPFAAGPAIPRDRALGPNFIGHALNPNGAPGSVGNPAGLAKLRDNAIRLAQAVNQVSTGDPNAAPYKWVGVLETPTSKQAQASSASPYCTAQFITSNVLLTAAHCLWDDTGPTGQWYDLKKAIFILQYQNGEGKQFQVACGLPNHLWKLPSNYNSMKSADQNAVFWPAAQHDFAMILVDGTSPTGYMRYALDWKGKYKYAFRVGYAEDIHNGDFVQGVGGPLFFANAIPTDYLDVPNLVVQWSPATDFTYGTSGGAWIANTDPTGKTDDPILIAVDSGSPVNGNDLIYPGGEFAAYLTEAEFNPLLASVQSGCK